MVRCKPSSMLGTEEEGERASVLPPDMKSSKEGRVTGPLTHNVGRCGPALECRGRENRGVPVAPQWVRSSPGAGRGGTPVQTAGSSRQGRELQPIWRQSCPAQWVQTVEGRPFHSSQKQKWVNQTAPHCPSKARLSEGS